MPFSCSKFLPLLLVICGSCKSTDGETIYSITLDEDTDASIKRPELCDIDIGNGGGDLVAAGVRYRGKCDGAGLAPKIEIDGVERYLKFATDPGYQDEVRDKNRTRTELALTSKWFAFGEPVFVGFRIRVPKGTDETNAFFYLMQFWQCAGAAPIAGVRMRRGYSHTVNFMTRGDSRAASMGTYDLRPDSWASFVIKATVDPTGENGSFLVWNDPNGEPRRFNGAYGHAKRGTCDNLVEPPQRFRLKFGIYKGTEVNKQYEVNYDDIRIGSGFDAVSPWINTS